MRKQWLTYSTLNITTRTQKQLTAGTQEYSIEMSENMKKSQDFLDRVTQREGILRESVSSVCLQMLQQIT